MNDLEIGQDILIKAKVVDNNLNNLKININKMDNLNQIINYVDINNIVNLYYKTTQELLNELQILADKENEEHLKLGGIGHEILEVGHDRLGIWFRYIDDEDDEEVLAYVSKFEEGIFEFDYDFINNKLDDKVDIVVKLILAYTYTPIKYRGFVEIFSKNQSYDDIF